MLWFSSLWCNDDHDGQKCITESKKHNLFTKSYYNNNKKKKPAPINCYQRLCTISRIINYYCIIWVIGAVAGSMLYVGAVSYSKEPSEAKLIACTSCHIIILLLLLLLLRRESDTNARVTDVRRWSLHTDSVNLVARITLSHVLPVPSMMVSITRIT